MFGIWYIKYLYPAEKTNEIWNKICPNKDKLKRILSEIGYNTISYQKIDAPFMNEERYLNIESPLKKEFRDADSFWGLITASEVEGCLEKLTKILEGDVPAF